MGYLDAIKPGGKKGMCTRVYPARRGHNIQRSVKAKTTLCTDEGLKIGPFGRSRRRKKQFGWGVKKMVL